MFPDRGKAAAQAIRKRFDRHEYDKITSAQEFADSLTRHHCGRSPTTCTCASTIATNHFRWAATASRLAAERAADLAQERLLNFGFDKAQRLPGNVGYIELRSCSDYPEAQPTALAAMRFLGNCDALILDLRRNGGGSPNMIATLLTYLVEPDRHLHFNDFYQRRPEGRRHRAMVDVSVGAGVEVRGQAGVRADQSAHRMRRRRNSPTTSRLTSSARSWVRSRPAAPIRVGCSG